MRSYPTGSIEMLRAMLTEIDKRDEPYPMRLSPNKMRALVLALAAGVGWCERDNVADTTLESAEHLLSAIAVTLDIDGV